MGAIIADLVDTGEKRDALGSGCSAGGAPSAAGLEFRLPDWTVLRGGNAVELAALMRALKDC